MRLRSQVSFEYLLLIAAALVLVVVLILLFQTNLFKPTESDITNKSAAIKSAIASVQPLGVGGEIQDSVPGAPKIPESPFGSST
ncbi:MAG: hypothetical protein QW343_01575 [Candidatus Norongarragalinales archaeon]